MNKEQVQADIPEAQAALYRLALSLDEFLVNGIQFGVFQRDIFGGFLSKIAKALLGDLGNLEKQLGHVPGAKGAKVP
jgi:hypothetical protein